MTTKQIDIKIRTYYFYNDLIYIKNFDRKISKLDTKQCYIIVFIILVVLQKKTEYDINSVNPLYLMINRIKGHFEEKDGDKYLIIIPENGDAIQKYQEAFNRLKKIIKKINDYSQPIKYDDNEMKIKFITYDNILLNKTIYLPAITITIRSVTKKDDKYYPQVFLDERLYQI